MNSKLISEPPLLVLPSLAREVGVTEAILLQQVFYAGQRTVDGWVERSFPDWHRAIRQVYSARTIERAFAKLQDLGWLENGGEAGKVGRWRVTPDKMSGDPRQDGTTDCRGSLSREETGENSTPKKSSRRVFKLEDEPDGFVDWLAHHVSVAASFGLSLSVPRAETSYRTGLARTWLLLTETEGYSREDMKLASEGVLSDDYMREHGHVKPDNVLRKEKIGRRIEDGKAWRARRDDGPSKYDHLDG